MRFTRRRFIGTLATGALLGDHGLQSAHAADITPWHQDIASKARALANTQTLQLLIPHGSETNVTATTDKFTQLSGVECVIRNVPVDKINVELILGSHGDSIDVALPATFGLIDLVQANVLMALDDYADKYEPPGFSKDYLYRKGDHYQGRLLGYQTDGDAYLLFYNKRMMQDPIAAKAYAQTTGKILEPASNWQDLDSMMAFFQRPEQDQYGGCLFRTAGYIVWEWWARFHAKGQLPFRADMRANINHDAGVEALEELIAAGNSQTPNAISNGLFENWDEFAAGNVFCNIGWGGTQKHMMAQAGMRDNLIHSALPGPIINGTASSMGYFNWGWNYTVSTGSSQPELAYLLALFCACPEVSTLAVREPDGYFDPFRESHYRDPKIRQVYGDSFLDAHRSSLISSIPDLYISGQSIYLDVLRQQIMATMQGELSAREALDFCAQKWSHITRRLGTQSQRQQWEKLLTYYPAAMQDQLQP